MSSQSTCVHGLHFSKALHLRPSTKDSSFCSNIFPRQGWGKIYKVYNFIFPQPLFFYFHFSRSSRPHDMGVGRGFRSKLREGPPHPPAPNGKIYFPTEVRLIFKSYIMAPLTPLIFWFVQILPFPPGWVNKVCPCSSI